MRALTLTQPWAGLVASGIKLVENRPRRMIKREDFGRPFAIHASREIDESVYDRIAEVAPDVLTIERRGESTIHTVPCFRDWYRFSRDTSAVIAVATIDGEIVDRIDRLRVRHWAERMTDLADDQARWFFGPIGYVLRDVRALAEPVPCRGWQGFWTLPPDVERQVMEQLHG
jgi:hypothetical protein